MEIIAQLKADLIEIKKEREGSLDEALERGIKMLDDENLECEFFGGPLVQVTARPKFAL